MSGDEQLNAAGFQNLIRHLEELLRDPHALRSDAIYGKPWTDAENEARSQFDRTKTDVANELARCNLAWSGRAAERTFRAQFEAVKQGLMGLLDARRLILARRDELRRMLKSEEQQMWLQEEIARLEKGVRGLRADAEYELLLRRVDDAFAGAERVVRRNFYRGSEPDELKSRRMQELSTVLDEYRLPVRAQFAAEAQNRLEAAQVQLHQVSTAISEAGSKEGRDVARSWRRWVGSFGVSVFLIAIFLGCVHWIPLVWMRDHEKAVSIQVLFCVLLVLGPLGWFLPSYRKWAWGGSGVGAVAIVGKIFDLL